MHRTTARAVIGLICTLLISVTLVGPSMQPSSAATTLPSHDDGGLALGGEFVWYSSAKRDAALDAMRAAGTKWIRIDIAWSAAEATKGTFSWAPFTATVKAARARGLDIVAILAYTPSWARPAGTSDKHPPANAADFARFAGAATAQLAPLGVHTYEVWNEPNISNFWQPKPSVAAYTSLLKAAYPAIHSADPTATVLTGGTAPATDAADGSTIAPITFLNGIYANGGRGAFDAFAHHPYSFPWAPSTPGSWNAFQQTATLHNVMVANGDGAKQIWGTEIGAPTAGSGAVTEAQQVSLFNEAYDLWARWSYTGPLLWYRWDDICTDTADRECWFGMVRTNGSSKPLRDAFQARFAPPELPSTTVPPSSTTTAPPATTTTAPTTTVSSVYDAELDPRVTTLRSRVAAAAARHATTIRLYRGVLGRLPDTSGLGAWSSRIAAGASTSSVARSMLTSSEYKWRYGTLSTARFVETTYRNLFSRLPTAAERYAASTALAGGSRSVWVARMVESTASRATSARRVEAVSSYLVVRSRVPTMAENVAWTGTGSSLAWRLARLARYTS